MREKVLNAKVKKHVKKPTEGSILYTHKGADKVLFTVVFVIFTLQCFTLIFPVLWMIVASCKEATEFFIGNPFALPEKWLLGNYVDAFYSLNIEGQATFFEMIGNSLWYTGISTAMSVFMPSVTGYVLSKYKFKGRDVIYTVAITAMTLPIVGSGASYMQLINDMGIYNTPLLPIIGGLGGFGGSFLVYYGFFKSVSWAYAEAASIDGAGPYTIFFKIMLPQAVPIMLTYAITNSISNWNAYESVLLYLPDYLTLAAGLFNYNSTARDNYPVYFAGLIISMIPTIALFSVFSDKIMTSISFGGLKG